MKMTTFGDGQLEEFLALLKKLKTEIDETSTTSPSNQTNFLSPMLRGSSLREFEELSLQGKITNNDLKNIMEGLLDYFLPLNVISDQKRAMRCAMRKPCDMPIKRFATQLTQINIFIPLLTGLESSKKITTE